MTKGPIVPQEVAYRAFHDAMRLFVGRGRRWSCAAVSEASGIPQRTVESYLAGQATPPLEKYQSLCAVLGQAFFAATIEHTQYEVRSTEPGDITAPQLLSGLLAVGGTLAGFLEDGRLDHRERSELKTHLADLQAVISAYETNQIAS